nr:EOG090X03KZ [Triops cancriformis]
MTEQHNTITVPEAPNGLCFSRDSFLKNEFSADSFLQDLRLQVPLEILRDDLGIYLKVLRSAMIELINRDYADFVNLSSNLVGLDKVISSLKLPLGTIREEIQGVERLLEENQTQLQQVLAEKGKCREQRRLLESMLRLPTNLVQLEKLVVSLSQPRVDRENQDNLLERAASQYNRLHHDCVRCQGTDLLRQNEQRIETAYKGLLNHLEKCLLKAMTEQRETELRGTLRVYALLDTCSVAEQVICEQIVRPALESRISETALKASDQDLKGVLSTVKEWIQQRLSLLIGLTLGSEAVGGYSALLHCVWPVFSSRLRSLPVFVQGNASLLHQRYVATMNFLDYLESKCGDTQTVQQLRNHPDYAALMNRWNLPVYFQIRLQEIGLAVETSILTPFALNDNELEVDPRFKLAVTQVVWESLHKTWASDVFLDVLAHRFWKLTLQLISRYKSFVLAVVEQGIAVAEGLASVGMTSSSSSSKLSEMELAAQSRMNHSISMPRLEPVRESVAQVDDWMLLYADVVMLQAHLPSVLDLALKQLGQLVKANVLEGAFTESQESLYGCLEAISRGIVENIEKECFVHLRSITDIPRLFRRTNREVPTQAAMYVGSLLQPIILFKQRNCTIVAPEVLDAWVLQITARVSKLFSISVTEVLTSVSKTEESLRRLRKARTPVPENSEKSKFLSDDDKIRHQLVIDVETFVRQVSELGVEEASVCQDLHEVVRSTKALLQKS